MIELRRRCSGSKWSDSPSFSRLPAGYQEVEYLESVGSQMLHLPAFNTNSDFNIEMSVSITEYSEWTPLLVSPAYLNIWIGCYQDNFVLRSYSGVNIITTKKPDINKFFSVKIRRVDEVLSLYINGTLINSATYTFNVTSDFFVYFADNPSNPAYSKFKSKELKYDNYHLIPCYRIFDRKPGMYDIVNDVFYVNQGTGEFLYGQNVSYNIPPEYQQVEWLEGTGAQAIITKSVLDLNSKLQIKFQIIEQDSTTYRFVAGARDNINARVEVIYNHKAKEFAVVFGYTVIQLPFEKVNEINTITIDNGKLIVNDTDEYRLSDTFYLNNRLAFFTSLQEGNLASSNSGHVRIYNATIETNLGDFNLIPCYRKSDDEAGMYDLVSGEFYTNAGAGKFDVGPLVI